MKEIKETKTKEQKGQNNNLPVCKYCGSNKTNKMGIVYNKQRYLCKKA